MSYLGCTIYVKHRQLKGNITMSTNLKALVEATRKAGGPATNVIELSAEQLKAVRIADEVCVEIVKASNGIVLYTAPTYNTIAPAMVQELHYVGSVYKSASREELGKEKSGTRIVAKGYYIQQDDEGNPTYNFFDDKNKPVTAEAYKEGNPRTPILVTTDEEGNPLPLQDLFAFKVEYGIDYNAPNNNRPKSVDMLNLIPDGGVVLQKKAEGSNFARVDWNAMDSCENLLKKPLILIDEMGAGMKLFESLIPINDKAPSKQMANAAKNTTTRQNVTATKLADEIPESAI